MTTVLNILGDIGNFPGIKPELRITNRSIERQLQAVPADAASLTVNINSPGGSVREGIGINNMLAEFAAKRRLSRSDFSVNTVVVGDAFSIAGIIALAGDKVTMMPGTMLMMHEASGPVFGNAAALRTRADYFEKATKQIAAIIDARMKKGEDEVLKLLAKETYFTAAEAKAAGLCDEVIERKLPGGVKTLINYHGQIDQIREEMGDTAGYGAVMNRRYDLMMAGKLEGHESGAEGGEEGDKPKSLDDLQARLIELA